MPRSEQSCLAVLLPAVTLFAPAAFHDQAEIDVGLKVGVAPLSHKAWLQISPLTGSRLSVPVTPSLGVVQVILAVQLVVWVTGAP